MRQGRFFTGGVAAIAALAVAPAGAAAASPLIDDTVSDFATANAGTSTWAIEPGLVRIKPTGAAVNFDNGLGDWTATPWSDGGAGTVAGGTLTLDGARANAAPTFAAPRSLEFRADFDDEPFQHVGLGNTLGTANEPWAIISTGPLGGGLFARTQNATGTVCQTCPSRSRTHLLRIRSASSGRRVPCSISSTEPPSATHRRSPSTRPSSPHRQRRNPRRHSRREGAEGRLARHVARVHQRQLRLARAGRR